MRWLLVMNLLLFQPVLLFKLATPLSTSRPSHRVSQQPPSHSTSNGGNPVDNPQLSKSVKILFLRHGATEWNSSPQYKLLHSTMEHSNKGSFYPGQYDLNISLLDSLLTPVGEAHSKQAGHLLRKNYPNIKYVFMSPLVRAVQTALIATRELQKRPEYHVVPWLREGISSIASLGWNCLEYLKKYPFIQGAERISDDKLWFLDYWDSEHDTTDLKGQLLEYCAGNHTVERILEFLREKEVPKLENLLQIKTRAFKALEEIRNFLVEKMQNEAIDVQDYQVLVVGHRKVFKPLLQSFRTVNQGNLNLKNGEITEVEISLA